MRISCSSHNALARVAVSLGLLLALVCPSADAVAERAATGTGKSRSKSKGGEQDEFQIHYQAGLQLYKKESYDEALIEFQKAFDLDALPSLLYNIGQLHRKLGNNRQAIDAYELYLRTDPDLTAQQREDLQHVINELRGADPALEPAPAPLVPVPAKAGAAAQKAGRFMANFGIGFGAGLNYPQLEAVLQLEAGYSVLKNGNGYVLIPLQFHLSDSLRLIMIPVGFQYDFKLPVNNLYVGLRGSLGYAVGFADGAAAPYVMNGAQVTHWGLFIPEANLKYVVKGRVNLGLQPVSFPVLFNGSGAVAYYRFLLFGGANF
jgi:tetratricopeptide (TPR) repeat protein